MEFVPIPLEVLESNEYQELTLADKYFLIELYRIYHDTERFTISSGKPEEYRQPPKINLGRKIARLVSCGLLEEVGAQKIENNCFRRVFAFKYPAFDKCEEVA